MKDGIIEPSDETLESVHQQVLQLNHLVEDVKLLSLLDAGALRLNFEQAAIGDVLDRSARGFLAKAQAKNVGLTVEADEGIPPVRMDAARILQVVDNLLENAVRHTPSEGAVTVCATMLSADEGRGFRGGHRRRHPRRRDRGRSSIDSDAADPSRARTTGGAGLGLAIAKNPRRGPRRTDRGREPPDWRNDLPVHHSDRPRSRAAFVSVLRYARYNRLIQTVR